ncbi:DoxX family membrane protein [Aquimarina sp. TRL1]|uniref:DoxX family membrane protein n=1 Tax=Aquimarina sp. (strain TRL1) TaxID=2736252 RepID=UPI00158C7787|nr:DoxX family membrane protein [Aquimarina sp. TRL1]QKX04599.1 DoxX family membrane protein [Aquimarina sp. TRL1]
MNIKITLGLRILLGILLLVFGSNKFIGFLPNFEFANPEAGVFFGALANSYVLKTVALTEIIAGILLLINKSVPFALLLIVPISINIVLFHITLDPANIAPAIVVFALNAYLIYRKWDHYKGLF